MGHVKVAVSQFFLAVNRGKQFFELDMKNGADHDRFLTLVDTAEVLDQLRYGRLLRHADPAQK